MGLETLYEYDRYAPLGNSGKVFTFPEAKDIVLAAYGNFSPKMAEVAEEFFQKNWIDATVRKGKRSGAFCASCDPRHHAYVLTNYLGTDRDVSTLAHELGHGVHAQLSRGNNFFNYDTPLTTAETASVFGEMLVFEDLKNKASSDREKMILIMGKVEEMIATVFRQIAMFRFEQKMHYTYREKGRIPLKDLNKWWVEEQQAMFGKSLVITEDHGYWWMYIHHFLAHFYVYAYHFGELLTLSFYKMYKAGAPNFEDRYIALLSAGGSSSPNELLGDFGINPADKKFWEGGIGVMKELLEEAENIAKKLSL